MNFEDHSTNTETDLENYGLTIVPVNSDGNYFLQQFLLI